MEGLWCRQSVESWELVLHWLESARVTQSSVYSVLAVCAVRGERGERLWQRQASVLVGQARGALHSFTIHYNTLLYTLQYTTIQYTTLHYIKIHSPQPAVSSVMWCCSQVMSDSQEEDSSSPRLGNNISIVRAGAGAGPQTKVRTCYNPLDNLSERTQSICIIICAGIFIGCKKISSW